MGHMAGMDGMATAPAWPLVAAMWTMMMVGMMLPSAAPTILLYARTHRHSPAMESAPPTAAFLVGYLACWTGFALLAAGLQIEIGSMGLVSRPAAA